MRLSAREIDTCRRYARGAEIGGHSNIRARDDRIAEIGVDQLVGQLGTLALSKWMLGTCQGHAEYAKGRESANRSPTAGDNGCDIIGCNVDVKSSLMRYRGRSPEEYNLLVRPRERHPFHVYVLALIEADLDLPPSEWPEVTVHLMGWTTDEELPPGGTDERFGNASVTPAYELHPLPPFRWAF
jgi:hypothetical protein